MLAQHSQLKGKKLKAFLLRKVSKALHCSLSFTSYVIEIITAVHEKYIMSLLVSVQILKRMQSYCLALRKVVFISTRCKLLVGNVNLVINHFNEFYSKNISLKYDYILIFKIKSNKS